MEEETPEALAVDIADVDVGVCRMAILLPPPESTAEELFVVSGIAIGTIEADDVVRDVVVDSAGEVGEDVLASSELSETGTTVRIDADDVTDWKDDSVIDVDMVGRI